MPSFAYIETRRSSEFGGQDQVAGGGERGVDKCPSRNSYRKDVVETAKLLDSYLEQPFPSITDR